MLILDFFALGLDLVEKVAVRDLAALLLEKVLQISWFDLLVEVEKFVVIILFVFVLVLLRFVQRKISPLVALLVIALEVTRRPIPLASVTVISKMGLGIFQNI